MAADPATTTDAPAEDGAETAEAVEVDERREALLAELRAGIGDALIATHVDPGRDLWARVSVEAWAEVAEVVRHRMGARYFGFLSAIDWLPSPYGRSMDSEVDKTLEAEALGSGGEAAEGPAEEADEDTEEMQHGVTGGETRFQLLARVAKVGDPEDLWGITLKADIPDGDGTPEAPTWTNTYAGADWHERETWEMYGINFLGHPGLRHIYLPGDFEGFPLRKDYPLISRIVKPWPGLVDVEALPEVPDVGSAAGAGGGDQSDVAGGGDPTDGAGGGDPTDGAGGGDQADGAGGGDATGSQSTGDGS